MNALNFSIEQLSNQAQITPSDLAQISMCRRDQNRLGFGYQLSFVKMLNRFPVQVPFELIDNILNYVSVQLSIPSNSIDSYTQRRETVAEHQERIRKYLNLERFEDFILPSLKKFLFQEACRLEQTSALMAKTEQFLRERKVLLPSGYTLHRLIGSQRKAAREHIFEKIVVSLPLKLRDRLDSLLDTKGKIFSDFHVIKQPPGRPSSMAMLKLVEKIKKIQDSGVLEIDLSWLSNNFQRSLAQYTKRCDAYKMRELDQKRRYSALICFLAQSYQDTMDFMVDMYDKLLQRIYNNAQDDIDKHNKSKRKQVRQSLIAFKKTAEMILDESIEDTVLRRQLFKIVGKEELTKHLSKIDALLHGKHSHVFNLVKNRFSYIRQFSPLFIKYLKLHSEGKNDSTLLYALEILQGMNDKKKRKVPEGVPLSFIPKKILPLVEIDGKVDKPAWECALLTVIRDEIKLGNYAVEGSKRFGKFEDFFIPQEEWEKMRGSFFRRAGLPCDPKDVGPYLKERLDSAFKKFLETLPQNTFAKIEKDGWHLSRDTGERLDEESKNGLERLKFWLSKNMRTIKLPELLIEVDNVLRMTRFFMTVSQKEAPKADDICEILSTIMAHGCNIGLHTMSQLIDGVSYSRLKHITGGKCKHSWQGITLF